MFKKNYKYEIKQLAIFTIKVLYVAVIFSVVL